MNPLGYSIIVYFTAGKISDESYLPPPPNLQQFLALGVQLNSITDSKYPVIKCSVYGT